VQTHETTDLARRWVEAAWNEGDYQTLEDLAAPDLSVYYPLLPAEVKGVADFSEVLREFRAGLTDMHFATEHLATQGSTVVFRWEGSGTHSGELMGIPATGREVRWTGITVVHVAHGKVVREWGEEDALGALRQLGAIPA
jgi:steroid delta-isomerase-like uncharacterized protein